MGDELASKFKVGENVLCLDARSSVMYEAKVEKLELRHTEFWYFVHYKNWKRKYDAWVPEKNLMELSKKNISKGQHTSQNQQTASGKKNTDEKSKAGDESKILKGPSTSKPQSTPGSLASQGGSKSTSSANIGPTSAPSTSSKTSPLKPGMVSPVRTPHISVLDFNQLSCSPTTFLAKLNSNSHSNPNPNDADPRRAAGEVASTSRAPERHESKPDEKVTKDDHAKPGPLPAPGSSSSVAVKRPVVPGPPKPPPITAWKAVTTPATQPAAGPSKPPSMIIVAGSTKSSSSTSSSVQRKLSMSIPDKEKQEAPSGNVLTRPQILDLKNSIREVIGSHDKGRTESSPEKSKPPIRVISVQGVQNLKQLTLSVERLEVVTNKVQVHAPSTSREKDPVERQEADKHSKPKDKEKSSEKKEKKKHKKSSSEDKEKKREKKSSEEKKVKKSEVGKEGKKSHTEEKKPKVKSEEEEQKRKRRKEEKERKKKLEEEKERQKLQTEEEQKKKVEEEERDNSSKRSSSDEKEKKQKHQRDKHDSGNSRKTTETGNEDTTKSVAVEEVKVELEIPGESSQSPPVNTAQQDPNRPGEKAVFDDSEGRVPRAPKVEDRREIESVQVASGSREMKLRPRNDKDTPADRSVKLKRRLSSRSATPDSIASSSKLGRFDKEDGELEIPVHALPVFIENPPKLASLCRMSSMPKGMPSGFQKQNTATEASGRNQSARAVMANMYAREVPRPAARKVISFKPLNVQTVTVPADGSKAPADSDEEDDEVGEQPKEVEVHYVLPDPIAPLAPTHVRAELSGEKCARIKKKKRGRKKLRPDNQDASDDESELSLSLVLDEDEEEEEYVCPLGLKLPVKLAEVLYDDWEKIRVDGKIPMGRASVTIREIMNEYERYVLAGIPEGTKKWIDTKDAIAELCAIFDKVFPMQFLYNFEKPFYVQKLKKEPSLKPCDFFGGPALVRILCKIGAVIDFSHQQESKEKTAIRDLLQDLMNFISFRCDTYCSFHEYYYAPPEYVRGYFPPSEEIPREPRCHSGSGITAGH